MKIHQAISYEPDSERRYTSICCRKLTNYRDRLNTPVIFAKYTGAYPLDLMFISQPWYHIQAISIRILHDKLSRNAPVT